LRAALLRLAEDTALGATLGEAAVRYLTAHHHPDRAVEQYAAMIEQVARQRQSRDAIWQERVCEALAQWPDAAAAEAIIEHWANLRHQGRQALRSQTGRRRRVRTGKP